MANRGTVTPREEAFDELFDDLSGDLLLTTSTVDDFAAVVGVLESSGIDGTVDVLTDGETAKQVRNTFILASRVVDRVAAGDLDVRVVDPRSPFSTLVIGPESVHGVASISDAVVTTLDADADASFVETAREAFEERWADADELSARTPAYSQMLETLGEELGEEVRADVEQIFERTAAEGGAEREIDPVRLTLLVGANHEVQFYELGLWGESEGLASRAKFSREKQALEEEDLLDTEKIPTDIGRPRQRLVLGDAIDSSDPDEIFDAARDALDG